MKCKVVLITKRKYILYINISKSTFPKTSICGIYLLPITSKKYYSIVPETILNRCARVCKKSKVNWDTVAPYILTNLLFIAINIKLYDKCSFACLNISSNKV